MGAKLGGQRHPNRPLGRVHSRHLQEVNPMHPRGGLPHTPALLPSPQLREEAVGQKETERVGG